jgi:hypothetical protein
MITISNITIKHGNITLNIGYMASTLRNLGLQEMGWYWLILKAFPV